MTKKENTIRIFLMVFSCFLFLHVKGQSMEKHLWKNRVLLVKTSDENNPKYEEQLIELSNLNAELSERKMVLYQIIGDKYKLTDFQNLEMNHSWKNSKSINNDLFDKQAHFEVIVIGLDGGIKLKKREVLEKKELFNLIDSMPMRMQETNKN